MGWAFKTNKTNYNKTNNKRDKTAFVSEYAP